ncbi:hypothetical protein [Propionivibrio sp.]|uniref:hypothetical protein n=1 Tax=Propionivibrio sp. TaxID=2212460 RepID=UPI003BF18CEE
MTLEEAKAMAFNAAQERLLNPDYQPTKDELAAIDLVLIEQKRKRVADTENTHATLT